MALDWNKEVNLSSVKNLFNRGGKSKRSSAGSYPSKATMNLYQGDKKETDVRKTVIVGVLLLAFVCLFVKFGVLDQLDALNARNAELATQQASLNQLKGNSGDFEAVKQKYDSLVAQYGGDSPDAITLLTMVEEFVMPRATVSSITLADGTLTLTLYNVPLDTVGDIAKTLEQQASVTSVNVTTATTQNAEGQNTISTLVVSLVGGQSKKG